MYVTSDYVVKPKEASVSIFRRQKILAAQGRRELQRCAMEHSIRVSDLKFNERRYHRLLNWLEDVKVRHKRTSQRRPSVVDSEKESKASIDDKSSPEMKETKSVSGGQTSSVFITHIAQDERRDSLEKEQQHYEALMDSMRKSLRSKLTSSEPLFRPRPLKYPLNSNRRGSLEALGKRKSVLPVLQVSTFPNHSRRRSLRLSAIPEADLKDEEREMGHHKKVSARKRTLPPLLSNKMTPSSTPRSSRTPALSPISETIDDLNLEVHTLPAKLEELSLEVDSSLLHGDTFHTNVRTKNKKQW